MSADYRTPAEILDKIEWEGGVFEAVVEHGGAGSEHVDPALYPNLYLLLREYEELGRQVDDLNWRIESELEGLIEAGD